MSEKDDPRTAGLLELPLIDLPDAHPCHGCGECCDYVAVEIDNPTGFKDYDNIFWYLTHRNVSVYLDWEGDWFIEFATPCEHQGPSKTCGIYEGRPRMCSDFSWDECERTTKEPAYKQRFLTPDEFFEWAKATRPKQFQKYLERRDKMLRKRTETRKASSTEG